MVRPRLVWLCRIGCVLFILFCIAPWRFATHYRYLSDAEMKAALWQQVTRNISLQQMEPCNYDDIVEDNAFSFQAYRQSEILEGEQILLGGEYYPEDCRPRFSTAIIVPYRQREEQLHAFLIYMHNYLRQQRLHYRIFLVEQYDRKPFNRAKMFNIGSVIAAEEGFPCLVLHDVDLLPLYGGHLYACTEWPRHMCAALDKFRFNLPYTGLFGGAVAMRTDQYRSVNGMSNLYEGWGAEDDDLYARLVKHHIPSCRFAPRFNAYTMMQHKPETHNPNAKRLLDNSEARIQYDGLNTLKYVERGRRLHSLFTQILVET